MQTEQAADKFARIEGHNAAIPARIAEATPQLDAKTVTLVSDAMAELAQFDASVGHLTVPFASILLRTESSSSSQIENLTSRAKAITHLVDRNILTPTSANKRNRTWAALSILTALDEFSDRSIRQPHRL